MLHKNGHRLLLTGTKQLDTGQTTYRYYIQVFPDVLYPSPSTSSRNRKLFLHLFKTRTKTFQHRSTTST